jgi:hypothetical protein
MGRRTRILNSDIKRVLPDGSIYLKEGVSYNKPVSDETEETASLVNMELRLKEKMEEINEGDKLSLD